MKVDVPLQVSAVMANRTICRRLPVWSSAITCNYSRLAPSPKKLCRAPILFRLRLTSFLHFQFVKASEWGTSHKPSSQKSSQLAWSFWISCRRLPSGVAIAHEKKSTCDRHFQEMLGGFLNVATYFLSFLSLLWHYSPLAVPIELPICDQGNAMPNAGDGF